MTQRKRVLSIGKDPVVVQLRNAVMSAAGYRVSSPHSVDDIPKLLENEPFDIIVLGHTIPRAERVALIKRIRALGKKVPILSLYTSPDTMDRLADCEVNALEGPEALLRAIHDCIGDAKGGTTIGRAER